MSRPYLSSLCLLLLVVSGAQALGGGVTLLPQEQAIANDMISNPGQGRPEMILDPIIEAVARARAKDMAVRGYFAHVNPDGHAANYLLRQAGYQLPSWWPTDPTLNYVESIAAGYSDAADTWNAWMNSPDHKQHLLAQVPFFVTETHYGVGFYADPKSQYQYYWVVITAPPQPLVITTPSADETVHTGTAAIAGTAAAGAVTIQSRIENSGTGAWVVATGTTNWSATVSGLAPGKNVVRVRSLDGSAAEIAEATRGIDYVPQTQLTVTVSGSGSVTSGYLGTTLQDEGSMITLQATPASGWLFTGWTGSVSGTSGKLVFTLEPGIAVRANFILNPFPAVSGNYYGVLTSGSDAAGYLQASLSGNGSITGRVFVSGTGYSFKGSLDLTGSGTVTISRKDLPSLTLTLQADLSGETQVLSGSITDGTVIESLSADHAAFVSHSNPASQAGRYTVVLSAAQGGDPSLVPQGNGYATISVNANGAASIAGKLGDGAAFTAGATVTENGTLPVYVVPKGERSGSSLNGLLTFRPTNVSDLDGSLVWTKVANPGNSLYPAGFSTRLNAVGSAYVSPNASSQSAPLNETVTLGDGDLQQTLIVPVTIAANGHGAMTVSGSTNLTLQVNFGSGAVSGKFTVPDSRVVRGFNGVLLQKQNAAFGYFLGADQSGFFSLTP